MKLTVNGEEKLLLSGITIAGLLEDIGVDQVKVAVERNFEIVPRSKYLTTVLNDGDKLEIVHFIGGG